MQSDLLFFSLSFPKQGITNHFHSHLKGSFPSKTGSVPSLRVSTYSVSTESTRNPLMDRIRSVKQPQKIDPAPIETKPNYWV